MPPEATTKTITVIPTPTNCPTSAAAAGQCSTFLLIELAIQCMYHHHAQNVIGFVFSTDSTSLQVETSSSQAASAPAAILAGLGIVASILHL